MVRFARIYKNACFYGHQIQIHIFSIAKKLKYYEYCTLSGQQNIETEVQLPFWKIIFSENHKNLLLFIVC